MIITDLYKTIITCDKTKVNMLSDGALIKIKLEDYNNNPVTNKNVHITCQNGSMEFNGTSKYSIDATTNSNGEVILNFKPSSIGFCSINANNNSLTIEGYRDTGWIVPTFSSNFTHYEGLTAQPLQYRCYNNVVEVRGTIKNTASVTPTVQFATLPSAYAPETRVVCLNQGSNANKYSLIIEPDGAMKIDVYSNTAIVSPIPKTDDGHWIHVFAIYTINK